MSHKQPMRSLRLLLATALLAVFSVVFALDGNEDQTVLQGLQDSPDQFSTFLSMLESAGLTDALQDPGPITVLAPTNAAFDDMDAGMLDSIQADPAQMTAVLSGLILDGSYSMVDLKDAADTGLTPLSGEAYDVDVTAGGLKINGVGFAATDVDNNFSNGVVHVTDAVVLPLSLKPLDNDEANADEDANAADTNDATDAPLAPVVPPAATEPSTPANATPATPAPEETAHAFVRVAQLSPTSTLQTQLSPQEDGRSAVDFGDLDYATVSDYHAVDAGKYLINSKGLNNDAALFEAPSHTFRDGRYYTIAVTGLEIPGDDTTTTSAEGFGGWLSNLFGAKDTNRDALATKVTVYEDDVREDATDSHVRIIDAAPGSPAFDVVTVNNEGDRNVLAGNMTYGDDSGAKKLNDDVTGLEVTAADSSVVALQLENMLPLPTDSTVFLIGTTFEGAPYQALVVGNGPGASAGTTSTQ